VSKLIISAYPFEGRKKIHLLEKMENFCGFLLMDIPKEVILTIKSFVNSVVAPALRVVS
jgi:hypothetical protein